LVPLHDPDAVQPVALVAFHVSVELAPLVTLGGDAARVRVGALGAIVMVAERVTVPPVPVQANV